MKKIQTDMTKRAIELLEMELGQDKLVLDVGCGSGLSGAVLNEYNVPWIGFDVSEPMLQQAQARGCSNGNLILSDMSNGVPFRGGAFDAVIGISCLQWLCSATFGGKEFEVLLKFFRSLRGCMTSNGRAVFQFYPENKEQSTMMTKAALKAGFKGGVMVDNPDIKKRAKHFLCLSLGMKQSFMRQADVQKWEELRSKRKRRGATDPADVATGQNKRSKRAPKDTRKSKYSGRHRSKRFSHV